MQPHYRSIATGVCLLASAVTRAGPPLSTEDPGILERGQWEIITAATASSTDSLDAYQSPMLDISLGVIADQVQLAVAPVYSFGITRANAERGIGDDSLNVRAGFDFVIEDDFHLLFSIATGLREPAGEDSLDYDLYVGLQWFR